MSAEIFGPPDFLPLTHVESLLTSPITHSDRERQVHAFG
jgi:hypothetical protein